MQSQLLRIHNFGPVRDCNLEITEFMVFTGEQASGKSTVAKSVFFFKNIPFLIESEIRKSQLENVPNRDSVDFSLKNLCIKSIRLNFLRTFGSSWGMEPDMYMEYTYKPDVKIRISLKKDTGNPNYIWIELPDEIINFLEHSDNGKEKSIFLNFMQSFFGQLSDIVYIPAGRSLLTLLSNQLGYIYGVMDDMQKRDIDFCTQSYLERILKLKTFFSKDLESLVNDTINLTDIKLDRDLVSQAQRLIAEILRGEYRNVNGEERLILSDGHYVKLNFASSGQQEAVWILNVLFYFLVNNKRAYFIIEEPESHLYPNIQKLITEFIALVKSDDNQILLTTHSPYVLGTLNNLLYAGEISGTVDGNHLCKIIPSECWLSRDQFMAYYMNDGHPKSCMDEGGGQIKNEVIDGASAEINEAYDKMIVLRYGED